MANEKNLKPQAHKLTLEEQSRAGKASGESRRKRKAMREQLELLLKLPLKDKKIKKQLEEMGIEENDINNQMALTVALYQSALQKNTKAYEIIRDTLGEKPLEKINIENSQTTKVLDSINKQLSNRGK